MNQTNVINHSEEMSKEHTFIWSKGISKWITHGEEIGFPRVWGTTFEPLPNETECPSVLQNYKIPPLESESDKVEKYVIDNS